MSNTACQIQYYRSGQLREKVHLRDGQKHGVALQWHRNGQLARQEPYQNGCLHGICRQWDEMGRLLGEYEIVDGTGLQRAWHDNGRLQTEFFTLNGKFCGRRRIWLRDGTLVVDEIDLNGIPVSAAAYRKAARIDRRLPPLCKLPAKLKPPSEIHVHRVFVRWLLSRPNQAEARKWFQSGKKRRSLGHFGRASAAATFVKELYRAGAVRVIVPDIYFDKSGNEFADGLVVDLPSDWMQRAAIRRVAARLRKQNLGSVQPEKDIGEAHLYLSMA
jgi:hypothetical protein